MIRAMGWLTGVCVGISAAVAVWGLGVASRVAPAAVPPAPCPTCGPDKRAVADEVIFSRETNRARRWLLGELPLQPHWSVADSARLVECMNARPSGGAGAVSPSDWYQAELVRAWALLAVGRRLSRDSSVSGCAPLLVTELTRRLADPSSRVRYAAACALMDAGAGLVDPDALRALESDPDPVVARTITHRLTHDHPPAGAERGNGDG